MPISTLTAGRGTAGRSYDYSDTELALDRRKIPVHRPLEPIVEDRRVQRLRQPLTLSSVVWAISPISAARPQGEPLRRVSAGPAEHRSHRGQHLAELVVQLAEISRSVDSRVAMSCCASSRRSDELDSRANSSRFDRMR
jgi:hypothetical protein